MSCELAATDCLFPFKHRRHTAISKTNLVREGKMVSRQASDHFVSYVYIGEAAAVLTPQQHKFSAVLNFFCICPILVGRNYVT
jgi:predicted SPOUT superfamily RNA methylase MTH1